MPRDDYPMRAVSVREVLQPEGQGLYIPSYQRQFTWDAQQIERLFEELLVGFNRAAEGGPLTCLGPTVLFDGRNSVRDTPDDILPLRVLHVVDGQQRLTSLLILIGELARRLRHTLSSSAPRALTEEARNARDRMVTCCDGLERCLWTTERSVGGQGPYAYLPRIIRQEVDVWGNSERDARYESLIALYLHERARDRAGEMPHEAAARDAKLRPVVDIIANNISQIEMPDEGETEDRLDEGRFDAELLGGLNELRLGEDARPADETGQHQEGALRVARLMHLADFLLDDVILLQILAPDEDSAFALFEPLNATGQPLTSIETFVPLVVKAEGGSAAYRDSLSEECFRVVDGYVPAELPAGERAKRVSALLTAFALVQDGTKLAHNVLDQRRYLRTTYLALQSEQATAISRQRHFVQGIAETASFLSSVWDIADARVTGVSDRAAALSLEVLRRSDHSIVIPLLVRYRERATRMQTAEATAEFGIVIRAISAFWTIWRSSMSRVSGIDGFHRRLMNGEREGTALGPMSRMAREAEELPTVAEVKSVLRQSLAQTLKVGDAESWSRRVLTQPLYHNQRIVVRYILMCAHDDTIVDLDNQGHGKRGVEGSWPTRSVDLLADNYSLEHIAPQSRPANDNSYDAKLYDEGEVDRLGNLMLIPSAVNQLLQNHPWGLKRRVFAVMAAQDPSERDEAIRDLRRDARRRSITLGEDNLTTLREGKYVPFGQFVARNTARQFSRAYVKERGSVLARLAWERLWRDLS